VVVGGGGGGGGGGEMSYEVTFYRCGLRSGRYNRMVKFGVFPLSSQKCQICSIRMVRTRAESLAVFRLELGPWEPQTKTLWGCVMLSLIPSLQFF